jgi:hydrogenase expression/formation protein HypE
MMDDKKNSVAMEGPVCPLPFQHNQKIVVGHGSGGKMTQDLITNLFLPPFANPILAAGEDAAVVATQGAARIVISTDSHVVWPLFFPGGDIGRLAVCGTVNDVAMMGANPRYITAGFILEEGLEFQTLEKIVHSMKTAAEEAGVQIVAGDTKVVESGKGDSIYINTTGVGLLEPGIEIGGSRAAPEDVVILSGPIGDHGIAVLSARGELGLEAQVKSDVAPLNSLTKAMLKASRGIHVMRDPTRGGVATALNEIACQSNVGILLYEGEIPVKPPVAAACEVLGFDPLYIANEGKLLAIVAREEHEAILKAMKATRYGTTAAVIGEVITDPPGRVLMRTNFGTTRVVDKLMGEMLPRIC